MPLSGTCKNVPAGKPSISNMVNAASMALDIHFGVRQYDYETLTERSVNILINPEQYSPKNTFLEDL